MVGFITIAPKRTLEQALGARSALEAMDDQANVRPKFVNTFKKVVPKKQSSAPADQPPAVLPQGGGHERAGPDPTSSTAPGFASSAKKTATGKRLKNVSGLEARLEREAACMDELFGSNDACPPTQPTQPVERTSDGDGRKGGGGCGASVHEQRHPAAAAAAAVPEDTEHSAKKPRLNGAAIGGGRTLSGCGGLKLAPALLKPNVIGIIKVDVAGCKFYTKAIQV